VPRQSPPAGRGLKADIKDNICWQTKKNARFGSGGAFPRAGEGGAVPLVVIGRGAVMHRPGPGGLVGVGSAHRRGGLGKRCRPV